MGQKAACDKYYQARIYIVRTKYVVLNDDNIEQDIQATFNASNGAECGKLDREQFVKTLISKIVAIWQMHPFREGNTQADER